MEIKCRLNIIESIFSDSNEAMYCEFISLILHSAILYIKRITKKNITLDLQFKVIDKKSISQVDYTIRLFINSQNCKIICII